jgi:hypothetical protein
MNKKVKGIILGITSSLLITGTTYAAYLVWSQATHTTVNEPISVDWDKKLPDNTFPNQNYQFGIHIGNANVDGNGDQKIKMIVTKSGNLDAVKVCLNADCSTYGFGDTISLTVAKNTWTYVQGEVKTSSDITPGDAWVKVDVSRE